MFERFTDRARKVMAIANEQVQLFNHQYIGTEHIFLGLVKEGGGTGAAVLKNLGVDIDKMLPEVEELFKLKGGKDAVSEGKIPQTQNAIKVIEYAIEEARNLNHDYIGTEHILLGLLRVSEGIAAQVLTNLGVSIENARMEIEKLPDRQ
jgi:ATP-dependent Clp protease ATP-binding subunit ClpC